MNTDQVVTSYPPEQVTSGGMHKVCETHHQEMQTKNNVHFALLQIVSTLEGAGLPSPTAMLFKRSIRALLPQIHREPINVNNDKSIKRT